MFDEIDLFVRQLHSEISDVPTEPVEDIHLTDVELTTEEESAEVETEIEESTELDKGTTVKYVVSIGKEKIQIPANEQFAGKTYAEVVKMILERETM